MRRGGASTERHAVRLLGLAAAAILLLAACGRVEVGVVLNDDGSGTLTTDLLVTRDALRQFTGDDSLEAFLSTVGLDVTTLPPDVIYIPRQTADQVGARFSVPFAAGDDVASEIDRAFGRLADDAGNLVRAGGIFESFDLERDGDGWGFAATMAGSDAPDGISALFLLASTMVFHLDLPGEVDAHNADEVGHDGTLTWRLPLDGSSRGLSARTVGADDGVPMALVTAGVVGAAGAAALGVVAMLLARRRVDTRG